MFGTGPQIGLFVQTVEGNKREISLVTIPSGAAATQKKGEKREENQTTC